MNTGRKLIASVMTRDVRQVGPQQAATDALALMRAGPVSSVLVVANQLILGIITERDIVRTLHGKIDLRALRCTDLMHARGMGGMQAGDATPAPGAIDEALLLANILRGMNGAAALATDLDWRICYASPGVAGLLGTSVAAMDGSDLRDALMAIGWKDAAAAQAMAGPGGARFEVPTTAGPLSVEVSVILDPQQDAKGYLLLARKA